MSHNHNMAQNAINNWPKIIVSWDVMPQSLVGCLLWNGGTYLQLHCSTNQKTLYLGLAICVCTTAEGSLIIHIKDWNVQFNSIPFNHSSCIKIFTNGQNLQNSAVVRSRPRKVLLDMLRYLQSLKS